MSPLTISASVPAPPPEVPTTDPHSADPSIAAGASVTHRVFIVEDHPAVREAYLSLLEQVPDVEVVGMASSAEEALEALPATRPDLSLVDISLPRMSGLDLIAELRLANPSLRALVVSGHERTVYAGRAREVGAVGYVVKADGPRALLEAIRRALKGGKE